MPGSRIALTPYTIANPGPGATRGTDQQKEQRKMKVTFVVPAGDSLNPIPVWERVHSVSIDLDNVFFDWSAHAHNPANGEPCTAATINRVAVEIKARVWDLRDCPGFTPTRRLAVALCDNAKGAATKSAKELRRRAQCLCDCKELLDAYRLAFVAGQDNPGV